MIKKDKKDDTWEEVFIIYLDDDDSKKTKVALIQREVGGIIIKITEEGVPFFIPYNRILKTKLRTWKKDDDGNKHI
jgi:hypothetical protein